MSPTIVSPPSNTVTMFEAPDTWQLWNRLGWAQDKDDTRLLLKWLAGIGQMMNKLDSISRDSYDTEGNVAPSWSTVLDIDRAPTYALPWLGQFVGARFPATLRDDQQRYIIMHSPGWSRGTPAAILAAANQYLLTGFVATLVERDTSPYHLAIEIPDAGVEGNATYESLFLSYPTYASLITEFATYGDLWGGTAAVLDAIAGALPAGLVAAISFV